MCGAYFCTKFFCRFSNGKRNNNNNTHLVSPPSPAPPSPFVRNECRHNKLFDDTKNKTSSV